MAGVKKDKVACTFSLDFTLRKHPIAPNTMDHANKGEHHNRIVSQSKNLYKAIVQHTL